MSKPLLSIGMIFKNEIRCLERCLKSLQPLRDAIPCELVMADTGATDGSRAVAERYADILIDFEWINDFAAARNAVMNQCSGKWYMSIDCDEWLGGDISKLVSFLKTDEECVLGAVVVRNYSSPGLEKDGEYNDFNAQRLLRMSTGLRYEGAIHEHWSIKGAIDVRLFTDVLFHHDGYLYIDPVVTREKHERNMKLLRKKLEDHPGDLTTLLQCIESADGTHDVSDYIRQAVQGVKDKREGWNLIGGAILRYAVVTDYRMGLPELEEHIRLAEEMLPDSIYTKVDIQFAAFGKAWQELQYKECIRRGERYLKALAEYHLGNYNRFETMCSTLLLGSPRWRTQLQLFLAGSYLYEGEPEKGFAILPKLDGSQMTVGNVNNAVQIYAHFHARSTLDTAPLIRRLWSQIICPIPDEDRGKQRRNEFIRVGADFFGRSYKESEERREDFHRHAYTMFLPLMGDCVLGNAAAILAEDGVPALEHMLSEVTEWDELPICAVAHALKQGARFPLPGRPMKMEELDILAGRLTQEKTYLNPLIEQLPGTLHQMDLQELDWARALTLAAIRSVSDWREKGLSDWNLLVTRTFAQAEKEFLPRCYAAEALTEGNINLLPPMHRFGWYCVQAFEALDSGDTLGYVRTLRAGLKSYGDMRAMVEFLIDNTPEVQAPVASAELETLAEQVRAVLAKFSPDDPAVAELKRSEAYQKVAHLIEGIAVPVMGGQMQ